MALDKQFRVTFQPQGRSVHVLVGTTLLEAANRAGLTIDTPCGGAGTCGKCRVQIIEGASEPPRSEQSILDAEELKDGWRLACQTTVRGDLVAHVPAGSLLFGDQHQILQSSATDAARDIQPAIRKVYAALPPPALSDDAPDLLRLERALGPIRANLALVRSLPGKLRQCDFRGTAVLADHSLLDFEAGDTTGRVFGAACDLGTTTLVIALVDLASGGELAVKSRVNPQVRFGDDVLSRIKRAGDCPDCLEEMRSAVIDEISRLIGELCEEAHVSHENVYEISIAGNTTMQHLLCGMDPKQLGEIPFVPAHARGLLVPARDLHIPIAHCGMAYLFPIIGGFVGGDTVAGMLATQLGGKEGPALLLDIGTNGEIVLAAGGRLWAASTAAGPAFEGARIACGMRATRGAIEKVVFDGDVALGVIGDTAPIGICGSGLIDVLAQLLDAGIVTPEGHLLPPEELPPSLPAALRARVRRNGQGGSVFVLHRGTPGIGDGPVVVTQKDIRELQLGCGAIRAGILILLRRAGLAVTDLASVLVAGGFGSFIRRNHAQRIGLLPEQLEHHRINYVGNASLAGAKLALLSASARKEAEEWARQTTHVGLSTDVDFQTTFCEAMLFPGPKGTGA